MNAQAETIATMPTQNEASNDSLLQIRGLKKRFSLSGDFLEQLRFKGGKLVRHQEFIHAINGVNLDIKRGEALCVVGESGCGKSTVARTVMGLISPSEGEIRYDGQRIDDLSSKQLLPYRKRMQMIFQNPYASLNPRMTIQQTLEEPLRLHHPDWKRQQILDKVEVWTRVLRRTAPADCDCSRTRRRPRIYRGRRAHFSTGRIHSGSGAQPADGCPTGP